MSVLTPILYLVILSLLLLSVLKYRHQKLLASARALGIKQIKQLKSLISTLQRHRGQSFNVIKGNQELALPLQQTNKEANILFSQLAELESNEGLQAAWYKLHKDWIALDKNNLTLDAPACIRLHSELILQLLHLIEDLADLQCIRQEIQPLFSILQTSEWVGQARAQGSSMLLGDNLCSVDRIRMSFLKAKLEDSLTVVSDSINDTTSLTKLSFLIDTIDQQLLSDQPATLAAKEYFELASQTIEYFMSLFDAKISS